MQNILFTPYKPQHYIPLKEMIFNFYQEDAEGFHTEMNEIKIQKTIEQATLYPKQLMIKIFSVENEVAGYSLISAYWSNEYGGLVAKIDELFIISKFRGQGISTQFLAELAQKEAYIMLDLEVFTTNKKALNLYKRLGFEVIDRFFMKKSL